MHAMITPLPNGRFGGPGNKWRPRPATGGFGLFQLMALLAVLSISATVLVPPLIKRVDQRAQETEAEALETFEDGLRGWIRRNAAIPDTSAWPASIAAQTPYSVEQIRTNPRGNARRFLVDPNFWALANATLPYEQTMGGLASPPNSPRMIFLSSVGAPLPTGYVDFEDLWSTPDGEVPTTWLLWPGRGRDLRIHKISLRNHFHHLFLFDVKDNGALYALEGKDPQRITDFDNAIYFREGYYLNQTPLMLFDPDGTIYRTELLRFNQVHVYKPGWLSLAGGEVEITLNGVGNLL